jgi:hypothetical protein
MQTDFVVVAEGLDVYVLRNVAAGRRRFVLWEKSFRLVDVWRLSPGKL